MEVEKANNFEFTNIGKGIIVPVTYNENLDNDPLLNSENEYLILNERFIEEYCLKVEYTKIEQLKRNFTTGFNFKEWENIQKKEVRDSFLKLVKELDQKNIFFFGCSFDNYKHNYDRRLKAFLEYFRDASQDDFIDVELEFLENILCDLKNYDDYPDDFYQPQIPNFGRVYELITIIGKQFHFSHNKKITFLKEKQDLIKQFVENIELRDKNEEEKSQNEILKITLEDGIYKSKKHISSSNYIEESSGVEDKTGNENLYIHIFSNGDSFYLFEKLFSYYKDSKNQLADFSFIYRMMYKDGYILPHFKPKMFIDWIGGEPYEICIDKIKTSDKCSTDAKIIAYSTAKELIQLK
jgi:hypothetical protein